MNKYFIDICVGGEEGGGQIKLFENNTLINDQTEIFEVFNDFLLM